jgi:hypothetical protein
MEITRETTEQYSQKCSAWQLRKNQKSFGQLCIGIAVSSLLLRPSIFHLSLRVGLGGQAFVMLWNLGEPLTASGIRRLEHPLWPD